MGEGGGRVAWEASLPVRSGPKGNWLGTGEGCFWNHLVVYGLRAEGYAGRNHAEGGGKSYFRTIKLYNALICTLPCGPNVLSFEHYNALVCWMFLADSREHPALNWLANSTSGLKKESKVEF